jgi:hypothetical protein
MSNLCKNCSLETTSNYCPNCGQRTKTKRIDGSFLLQEFIMNNFTFHNGLLYTMKSLILHPKQVVENYLAGKRARYTGAVQFLLFMLIFMGLFSLLHKEIRHVNHVITSSHSLSTIIFIKRWLKNILVLLTLTSTFSTYLVYRKKKYNLAEHLIVNFYISGMSLFLSNLIVMITFYKFESVGPLILFAFIISYYIRIFYDEKIKILDFIIGLWCFLLSVILYLPLYGSLLFMFRSGWLK